MMTLEELSKFTYSVYVKFLNILGKKYEIIPCSQAHNTHTPYLILRHDVDGSLESALEMAKVEHDLGISSTYTVLFSHKLYNVFEKDSFSILREILDLGHEIGVHYEVETLALYNCDLEFLLKEEVRILGHMLDENICVVTQHKGVVKTPDPLEDVTSLINTSSPGMFDLKVTDSYRVWGREWIEKLWSYKYNKVQLVTHPCLWTENVMGWEECLEEMFERAKKKNEEYKREWMGIWNDVSIT